MTAPGLSAGWEAGGGVASFPGRDAEPTCGQGDLPPWGGPALPSGKGLKPQESGGRQQGRDPSWCFRGGVGGGSAGSQDSEPSPGPWGTARWASLSSLMSHGRGALSDAAQGPPAPRSPARPRSPSTRPPQAPPPAGRPGPHLPESSREGLRWARPGLSPRSISLPSAQQASGSWLPPGPQAHARSGGGDARAWRGCCLGPALCPGSYPGVPACRASLCRRPGSSSRLPREEGLQP